MSTIEISIELEVDGVPIREYPIVRNTAIDVLERPEFRKQTDTAPAFEALRELQRFNVDNVVLIEADERMWFRFAGQSDRGVLVEPHGFILLVDARLEPPNPGDSLVSAQNLGTPAYLHALFGGVAAQR